MLELRVKVTFTEEVLGMQPRDEGVYREYIASRAPSQGEADKEAEEFSVDEAVEKHTTVFFRNPETGKPCFRDYQWKGFFKDACSALRRVPASKSSSCKAYKKVIDGLVFIGERFADIEQSGDMGLCERPLRASTAQGEMTSIAISESIPAGSTTEFHVRLLNKADEPLVMEWLNYGQIRGTGQWRSSGKGRFTCEILERNETDSLF